ncbi:hypothetical protein HOC35_05925 [Candidatus Woesearchaeota archaeon]|nr:hypothetical protein [Candidatus Woesearchaeota archaeon]
MENKNTSTGNMPVKRISAGAISVSIWQNSGEKDGRQYEFSSMSIDRAYKDKEGAWQHTSQLRTADLPKAVVVLSKAYEFLILKEKATAQ